MASNHFGAKIQLRVDRSDSARQQFIRDIQQLADSAVGANGPKIKEIRIDQPAAFPGFHRQVQQLANQLRGNKAPVIPEIRIGSINANRAIQELQSQMGQAMDGFYIAGGQKESSSLSGGKDLGAAAESAGELTDELAEGIKLTAELTGAMKSLAAASQAVTASYKSALGGKNSIDDKEQLAVITDRYMDWQAKIEELKRAKTTASKEAAAGLISEGLAIQEQIRSIQKLQQAQRQEAQEAKQAAQVKMASLQAIANLQKQITDYRNTNPRVDSRFGNQLDNIMGQLNTETGITADRLSMLRGQFAQVRAEAVQLGIQGKNAFDLIAGAYAKFGGWLLVTRSTAAAIRMMKQMVTTVKELDVSLTDLRIITKETGESFDQFMKNTARTAKDAGASISGLLKSATTWARLGYSLNESLELAKSATIFSNIAGDNLDIDTATTSLVATLKAFNYEAEHAIDIVDKLTQVGNNFAIDAAGIGEALQNSAAALVAAGNDIDQSIALITAGNLVTQDPSKVGNALKTSALRIRGAKAELEEMGEEVDTLVSSTAKLRDELLGLSGVDIMLDGENFKSTYQILKEIAQVWTEISDINQAAVLEALGGKRNANVIASILQNFEEAEAVLQSSMNAAGAAMAANEKRLDSISGKLERYKAAFEELSNTFISTDLIKGLVDGGTAFLSVLTVIIDKLGALPTLLGALSMGFSTNDVKSILTPFQVTDQGIQFSLHQGIHKDIEAIKAYNEALKQGAAMQDAMEASMKNASSAAAALAVRYKGAAVPVGDLTGRLIGQKAAALAAATAQAVLNAVWTMGVSLLISGLISAITNYINKEKEARDAAKEAAQAAYGLGDEISRLALKYMELSEAVKEDQSAKEALITTQNQLLEKLQAEKSTLTELIREYGSLDNAMKELSITKLQEAQRDLVGGIDAAMKELLEAANGKWYQSKTLIDFSGLDYDRNTMDLLQDKGLADAAWYGGSGGMVSMLQYDLDTAEGIIEAYEYLGEILDAIISKLGTEAAAGDQVFQNVHARYNELTPVVSAYKNAVNELNGNLAAQHLLQQLIGQELPKTQEEFDLLKENLLSAAAASGQFIGSTADIENAVLKVLSLQSQFAAFILIPDAGEDEAARYTASLSQLSDTMSELKTAYTALEAAEKEMNETGGISADTISKLAAFTDNYLDCLYEEQGLVKLNTQAWREFSEVQSKRDIAEIEKEIAGLREYRQELQDTLDVYTRYRDGYEEGPEFSYWNGKVKETQAALNECNGAIETNQEKLKLYQGIFDSMGTIDLSNAITGLEAFQAASDGMQKIVDAVSSYSDKMATLADLQAAVADGFVLSTQKAMEFAAVYPEILNGAQVAADGQLQLNEDVVNAFIEGKRAELDSALNVAVANLEAEKIKLGAKKESAEAQLALANAVAEGEVDIEKAKAQLLADAEQVLTQYLIDLGVDEVEAQKAAAEAKAGNMEEYARIVGDVADDNAENLAQAMVDAANSTKNNVGQMVSSLDSLGRQAANVAAQVAAIGDGQKTYNGMVTVGGGGVDVSGFTPTYRDYNFQGVDPKSVEALALGVGDWIHNLELDISGYTRAIAQIDGQISALNALKNIPLSDFESGGSKNSGGSKKAKEIEEYIAAVNRLYEAEERLKDIQGQKSHLDLMLSMTDSYGEQLKLLRQINDLHVEEQKALHEINNLRDKMIGENVERLRSVGFDITYDQDSNYLFIANLEIINNLLGETQEETNVLRKEYEQLISSTIALNDANKENSKQWWALKKAIQDVNKEIVDTTLKVYDDFIKYADDFDLWEHTSFSRVDYLKLKLEEINRLYEEGLIPNAEQYKDLVNLVGLEIYREQKNALEYIISLTMKLIKQEAKDKVDALKKQIDLYLKIIELKKKELELNKNEEDYQKNVDRKLRDIAKLQSEIDQLSLDESREAQAEKIKLEEELAKLQEDLADYQADYSYKAQMDALDKEAEAHKQQKEDEIKTIEETVDTTAKLYELAIDRINNHWDTLYDDLIAWNAVYGDGIAGENSIKSAWELATQAVERYGDALSALEGIKTENSVANQQGMGGDTKEQAEVTALVSRMKANSNQWPEANESKRRELEARNRDLARQVSSLIGRTVVIGGDGEWYIDQVGGKRLYSVYHRGGIVGDQPTLKQNEVMAVLEKGEAVLDGKKENALFELIDFTSGLSDKLGKAMNNFSPENLLSGLGLGAEHDLPLQHGNITEQFSPTVIVNVNGSVNSELDAEAVGRKAAESALETLKNAFNKKGVSMGSLAVLKP